jgi:hypothetical protein
MSIGNIRNTNDLQNKKQEFAEYLQLMIDNESIKEKRIKDYKNPNKPPPVPPQYKTASEQAKDLIIQEKLAMDNMKELGIDISEVRSFVMQLEQKQDGIDNLVKLNRNFPAFKKLISEKYLAKTLDAPLLLNAWEEFSVNINAITGLKSVSSNSTNVYSTASDNYKKLPSQDDILSFTQFANENLFTQAELTFSDTVKASLLKSLNESSSSLLDLASINKIDDLSPLEIRQINDLAENLLTIFKIPTKNDLISKFDNIEKSLSELNDTNSVTINDTITKDLIVLNRFLASFNDDTTKKKLAEYNKFIMDKITGLFSEVKEAVRGATPSDIAEPPLFPISGGVRTGSSKVDTVNYIMMNKLYNKAKYDKTGKKTLFFSGIKLDKNYKNIQSEEEIRNIISNYTLTQLNSILRQIKNKEQRRGTANRAEEVSMGEEEELSRQAEEERKEAEYQFQKIYSSLHRKYEDLNPSMEEIVLLIDAIAKNFIVGIPEAGDFLNHLEEVITYASTTDNKDYLLDEAISLFSVNENAPDFIMNYVKTIEAMRRRGLSVSSRISEEEKLLLQAENKGKKASKKGEGMSRPQARRITEAVNTPDFNPHFEDSYSSEEETGLFGFGVKKKKKKGGDLIHIDIGSHIGKHYKEASGKGVNDKKLFAKAKKEYQSGGDQPYIKSRIKIGSGISKTESPTYQEFGKFIIHTPQLEKNILNFKYPSLGRVPNLPRTNIDDDTKDLIFNILETGKMSENLFNKIPQS